MGKGFSCTHNYWKIGQKLSPSNIVYYQFIFTSNPVSLVYDTLFFFAFHKLHFKWFDQMYLISKRSVAGRCILLIDTNTNFHDNGVEAAEVFILLVIYLS